MPRWTEAELRVAVAAADSISDVLRHFGLRTAGGNHALVRRWVDRWEIPTDHFTYTHQGRARGRQARRPLEEVLVAGATVNNGRLKARLYDEGVKARVCELCGQGEEWRGCRMALILDHVNGIHDDNRLENLRIVCPNCNSTLPTHCGKNLPRAHEPRPCPECRRTFQPSSRDQRFCSRACWQASRRRPRPDMRRVERPPYEQLMDEIATSSWAAVGRAYGVSCNAVRKWAQAYQGERAEAAEGAREVRRDAA